MNIILLKDLEENCVDAVIIATTSTTNEIAVAIEKAKEKEDCQWEDLIKALPKDCTIYDKWLNLDVIYY